MVEVVVHATTHDILSEEITVENTVLLINVENAFNSINRKVMRHNVKFLCPLISVYI